jgi:hypothetical protein
VVDTIFQDIADFIVRRETCMRLSGEDGASDRSKEKISTRDHSHNLIK